MNQSVIGACIQILFVTYARVCADMLDSTSCRHYCAVRHACSGVRSPDGVLLSTREVPQPPAAPGPYSAEIDNFRFAPTPIDVTAGGELTWTNKQNVEHTVVSDDNRFHSGVLGLNDTFSTKFTAPGTYPYHCSIHPIMKGTVVVK